MSTYITNRTSVFNQRNLFVENTSESDGESFSNLLSSTGGTFDAHQERTYSNFTFQANDLTYNYIGEWTVEADRGLLSGTVRAHGHYDRIEVRSGSEIVAIYDGPPAQVDFGTYSGSIVLGLLGDVLNAVTTLLFGPSATTTAFANLHYDATPDLLEKSFSGSDFVIGNDQNNTLYGAAGNDSLSGSLGADHLYGGDGHDYLSGGLGNDVLFGDAGGDALFGDAGADVMSGGIGDDLYSVDDVGDAVMESFNSGYDEVYASVNFTLSDNVETLFLTGTSVYGTGNSGNNAIIGNNANNVLDAGAGATDFINGAGGNDLIIGGAGHDEMMGGTGADIFRFAAPSEGVYDFIYDFTPGQDHIQLNASAFGISSLVDGVNFAAGAAPTVKAGGPSILYNTVYGYFFFDADGAGSQSPVPLGLLNGVPNLSVNDFLLY